jgi:hypothetical protein
MTGGAPPQASRWSFRPRTVDPAVTLILACFLAIGALTWSGLRSARAADARKAELSRVRTELEGFEDLNRRYAPAAAAESLSWRQTWAQLRQLGVFGDDRLGMTQQVSRAAEDAGLSDVRVLIGPPDTTGLETRLSTEGIRRKPASFSLLVEGRGGMRSVIAFLGRLPPSVVVSGLSLVRQDARQRHRISLAVYELEFTNGSPAGTSDVWPPLERGAAGGGDDRRPGG